MGKGGLFRAIAYVAPSASTRRWACRMGGVAVGSGVRIAPHVTFKDGVVLGARSDVHEHAYLEYVTLGDGSVVERGAVLRGTAARPIEIGRESYIGPWTYLDGSGGLVIGDFVQFAGLASSVWTHSTVREAVAGVSLGSPGYREEAPVRIGSRTWIGANVTLYPGVEIGSEVVILPHAVVTESVEGKTMVGGVPATVKKRL